LLTPSFAFLIIAIKEVSFFHSFYAENFLKKRDFGVKKQSGTDGRHGQAVSKARENRAKKSKLLKNRGIEYITVISIGG
jgi:hypothetical protein